MRYVASRIDREERDEMYRIYVTTSLQNIPQRKYLQTSYIDMLQERYEPVDERTGDEIAADVIDKLGLKLRGA